MTARVTAEEITSGAKRSLLKGQNTLRIPISSVAEAYLTEPVTAQACGRDCLRDAGRETNGVPGVLLFLKDGTRQFIPFEYPARALKAIQDAMGIAAVAP